MNVVLYMRYSSDRQTEQSIEGQQRICRQYCENHGMKIVKEYVDRALSASKDTDKRVEFQEMIKDSEKQLWEAVVVYKLDRFARNRYDSATYKAKLRKNGVKVISATENISDNPEGIILEAVLEGMAEFYSKELSQKITRGMYESAHKCNSIGGSVPLGYKIENKKLVLDMATVDIVKEAFDLYAKGSSIADICVEFNNKGYRTAKGVEFNKNSFRSMFKNERYIGIYKYKDYRVEGGVPDIVDVETFDKVQNRLHKNAQSPARGKALVDYLLSGKLFCGHCGSFMVGESGTSHTGAKHNYYICANKKRKNGCKKKTLRKKVLERAVVEDILLWLNDEHIDEIAEMAIKQTELDLEENAAIPSLRQNLLETEQSIRNLIKLVENGADSSSLTNRLNELEDETIAIQMQLDDAMKDIVILEKPHVVAWLTSFCNGDIEDEEFRRHIIDLLVNSVTVWDEPDGYKITSTYNLISNRTKTLHLPLKAGRFGFEGSTSTK